jgi:hypothetical protein
MKGELSMVSRKHIATWVSAGLLVATLAVAADLPKDPAPTPLGPPPSATVLWVYGDPSPQWQILDDFDTKEECAKSLTTIKPTQGQDAGCFRVGVDPARLHELYGTTPAPTPVK